MESELHAANPVLVLAFRIFVSSLVTAEDLTKNKCVLVAFTNNFWMVDILGSVTYVTLPYPLSISAIYLVSLSHRGSKSSNRDNMPFE